MALLVPAGDGGYEQRLEGIGIRYAALAESLGASYTARQSCQPDSAPTAKGYFAYNGLVASLTGGLRDSGWRRINLNGVLPLLVHDDLREILGVSSGDTMTGTSNVRREPRSRYSKGELTRRLLRSNQPPGQGVLFESPSTEEPPEEFDGYSYWLFMVYFDKTKKEIRSEVSLPESQNAKGYVSRWFHRIQLPPYAVDDLPGDDDPNGGFGPIDVPVDPR
ncbi:hypothetical protein [Micromonospora globosa]|uniref:hypothetical protein n=1 Tax=Micromonospora globosa TaxID=47863 RepID=UPI0004BEF6CF|nr:hypothetical protein [Micromonospora globosa]